MIECGDKMVEVLLKNNLVLNPTSPHIKDLKPSFSKWIKKDRGAIYAKMQNRPRYQPSKFGQTSDMKTRQDRYCTQFGSASIDLIVVVNFDSVPAEVDKQLVDLYNDFMRAMLRMPSVPDEIKTFVRILIEREGETLGPKRRIVMSILETGIQKFFGHEPGPSEAFMFDEAVFGERKAYVDDTSSAVVRLLVGLGVSSEPASTAMDSWATAYDDVLVKNWDEEKDGPVPTLLSSQIVGSEYVSGEAHEDSIEYPANPGATDRDLAFSTKEYTSYDKARGRLQVRMWILRVRRLGGVHLLDYNCDPLFPDDKLERVLADEFGYVHVATVGSGEIKVFFNDSFKSAILLHRPYGIGGDSRDFVTIKRCIRRLVTIEILRRVVDQLSDVPPPGRPETAPYAAIIATYISEGCRTGIHIPKRREQVLKREVLTSPSINACKITNLARHDPDPSYPVSRRVRAALRERHVPLSDMRINHHIIQDALRMLSFIDDDENDADEMLDRIGEWFAKDRTKKAAIRKRWKSLLKACPQNSKIRTIVDSYHKRTRNNAGNKNATGKPEAQLKKCDDDMERILNELYPSQKWFWIRAKGRDPLPVPESIADDIVLVNLSFEGVRSNLKGKNKNSGKRILKWNEEWPDKKSGNGGVYRDGFVKAVVDDKE
mmetsp:Transcript_3925/g.9225  ORF Transcript_3925/g.9225 Transcript_3925/m.9225 type:complete len:657 (+) Transcript_3925:3-1973(+)